jgi:antitoxin HicB
MKKRHFGSSFDGWLRDEGIYEEVTANAIKRVLARRVDAAKNKKRLFKAKMARKILPSQLALLRSYFVQQ